jgi:DNA-binding MarR family transcriptional regulator
VRTKPDGGWSKLPNELVDVALANLSGSAVKVYLILLRHADRSGLAWPSRGRIARLAGISIRTVSVAVDGLEQHRLITRRRGGSGFSNRYQLLANLMCSPSHTTPAENFPTPSSPQHISGAAHRPPTIPMYSDPDKKMDLLRSEGKESDDTAQSKLAGLSDERIAELKRRVLAKLPTFTAGKLADKDARKSPILSALIAGEFAMQAGTGEPQAIADRLGGTMLS